MKDAMISVRMPSNMIKELKELAEKNHYIDLSEQLRDVIRIKCSKLLSEPADSKQKTEHSGQKTERKEQITDKQRLVLELSKIVEELKKEI